MTSIPSATDGRKGWGIKDSGQLLFKGKRLAYALYCIKKQYLPAADLALSHSLAAHCHC